MLVLPPPDPIAGPSPTPACAWWQQADQLGLGGGAARPVERFPCEASRIVRRVAARVAADCAARGVDLHEWTPPTPWLVVDPWRLDLALTALAHSALRSSRVGDRLVLAAMSEPTHVAFALAADPDGWRTRLEGALAGDPDRDPRDAADRLALRVARRAVDDHLGSLELVLEPCRVQVVLRIPVDPERS